jgi:hypothetical protein
MCENVALALRCTLLPAINLGLLTWMDGIDV